MKKTILILKNELWSVISRRSFILTLILVPLGGLVAMWVVSMLQAGQSNGAQNAVVQAFTGPAAPVMDGYVDQSGLLKQIPAELQGQLKGYASEEEARQAISAGEIASYYLIPADYLQTGHVISMRPDFNPVNAFDRSGVLKRAFAYNLLDGDIQLVNRVESPAAVKTQLLQEEAPQRDDNNELTFFLPYIVTILFYVMIISSSSLMLSSISAEKQNRVMEILMTSVTPVQLLTGKIIALGLAGLLQTVVWSSCGLLLLRGSGQFLQVSDEFQLPVSILAWGVVFFVLGYLLYASLMAGLGALTPNLRESSQVTTVIILPLIVPMMFISLLIEDPNGAVAVGLSLFPLTSPVGMMTRLAATNVPFWQPVLAAVLLLGTGYLAIRAVAGMFRAQNLLSGQTPNIRLFFMALIGKA